jgi:hypothetical protein
VVGRNELHFLKFLTHIVSTEFLYQYTLLLSAKYNFAFNNLTLKKFDAKSLSKDE